MPADGGLSATNKAGTKYGTGYCDAQCPKDIKFIEGKANSDGWTASSNNANTGSGTTGSCCNEMDIWEANGISNALTPHVCNPGNAACTSDATCGNGDGNRYKGYCDKDGCDFNPFRMGNTSFYGPGKTIDTTKPLTVVTQFITSDNTASGDLVEIRRKYVQGGKVFDQPTSNVAGVSGNAINDNFCKNQKSVFGDTNDFAAKGGLKGMGDAFADGMVLVMSLWDDYDVNMHWLNSPYPETADPSKPGVARGTCSTTSGKPADVESQTPGATVVYSNIKTGPIGSTYSGTQQPGGSTGGGSSSSSSSSVRTSSTTSRSSSTTSRATTTSVRTTTTTTSARTTTTSAAGGVAQKFAQCGVRVPYYLYHACYSPCILTRITGHWMDWSYYLRQRIYLYQGQRLLLAVLVDAWRYHQNDVDAKTDTRAGHEGAVATTRSSLIVTFVMQQFELLHSQIFS
jgi:cellulose 1,4-beta-cellobiosidase